MARPECTHKSGLMLLTQHCSMHLFVQCACLPLPSSKETIFRRYLLLKGTACHEPSWWISSPPVEEVSYGLMGSPGMSWYFLNTSCSLLSSPSPYLPALLLGPVPRQRASSSSRPSNHTKRLRAHAVQCKHVSTVSPSHLTSMRPVCMKAQRCSES